MSPSMSPKVTDAAKCAKPQPKRLANLVGADSGKFVAVVVVVVAVVSAVVDSVAAVAGFGRRSSAVVGAAPEAGEAARQPDPCLRGDSEDLSPDTASRSCY